ncbi:hypothetical protein ACFQY0_01095 [Haloferula chungangensis]|uniref:DNA primase/polymerase bifunctional N-terminal domain-containing protein n=1 Tax=Haloferula chungangensis TaxID=1048331 RepID=A0ABW2L2G3_9BACT
MATLQSYDGTLRRRFQHREVESTVEKVYSTTIDKCGDYSKPPELPTWNKRETLRLHREINATADTLRELSPMEDPETISPEGIIRRLFPDPETLLCIGRSNREFKTATLAGFDDLKNHQFIVAAPMIARWGKTQTGKPSQHTKEATGPRAYIVCDFDDPPPEQHPSIIMQLMKFRGAALVLSSGGKSKHAWFPTTPHTDRDRIFWRTCLALGADPALYRNHSQFVRMPNGTRDNGKPQEVVYFNPNNITQ